MNDVVLTMDVMEYVFWIKIFPYLALIWLLIVGIKWITKER